VQVIFISHTMVIVYIYKIINLFYLTKGKGAVHGVSW
jgi:hypothetical protein